MKLLHSQAGVALLALMLIIIAGSSYLLLTKLNRQLVFQGQDSELLVLRDAKNALIGFSLSYPDRNSSLRGPGYLPCPSKTDDGTAEPSCSLTGVNPTTGWFPFETLELPVTKDGSGAILWYALSANYRNFLSAPANALNSETLGTLTVDGAGDIVAVIIAPGAPVMHQSRSTNTGDAVQDVGNYLEGANAEASVDFVSTLAGEKKNDGEYLANGDYIFNDRLIFITRQELMFFVEKRILAEVDRMLIRQQMLNGRYPWLSPFAEPAVPDDISVFQVQAGTYEGHIALSDSIGDPIATGLPEWFTLNRWHHLVYVAYASEIVPGGGMPCTAGSDCLTLHDGGDQINNIRALTMIAGANLSATRPSNDLSAYFEGENSSPGDGIFEKRRTTNVFNDQIRIVSTTP